MHALLSPLGFGVLLAIVLLATWRRLGRLPRALLVAVECLLLVAVCPVGANALVWLSESRVPAPTACAAPLPTTIVVLSAGFDRPPENVEDFAALSHDSVRRLIAGVELWRRTPAATLVFAGGGPFAISESAVLERFAKRMGVAAERIRREARSQTTWENAEMLRDLVPPLPRRIWLVSSALHLPRALIAFRTNGFDACAYASDRRFLPPGGVGYFLPQSSSLRKAEAALHELAGQALYRWRAFAAAR